MWTLRCAKAFHQNVWLHRWWWPRPVSIAPMFRCLQSSTFKCCTNWTILVSYTNEQQLFGILAENHSYSTFGIVAVLVWSFRPASIYNNSYGRYSLVEVSSCLGQLTFSISSFNHPAWEDVFQFNMEQLLCSCENTFWHPMYIHGCQWIVKLCTSTTCDYLSKHCYNVHMPYTFVIFYFVWWIYFKLLLTFVTFNDKSYCQSCTTLDILQNTRATTACTMGGYCRYTLCYVMHVHNRGTRSAGVGKLLQYRNRFVPSPCNSLTSLSLPLLTFVACPIGSDVIRSPLTHDEWHLRENWERTALSWQNSQRAIRIGLTLAHDYLRVNSDPLAYQQKLFYHDKTIIIRLGMPKITTNVVRNLRTLGTIFLTITLSTLGRRSNSTPNIFIVNYEYNLHLIMKGTPATLKLDKCKQVKMADCGRIWSNYEIAMCGFCTLNNQVFWWHKQFWIKNLPSKVTV